MTVAEGVADLVLDHVAPVRPQRPSIGWLHSSTAKDLRTTFSPLRHESRPSVSRGAQRSSAVWGVAIRMRTVGSLSTRWSKVRHHRLPSPLLAKDGVDGVGHRAGIEVESRLYLDRVDQGAGPGRFRAARAMRKPPDADSGPPVRSRRWLHPTEARAGAGLPWPMLSGWGGGLAGRPEGLDAARPDLGRADLAERLRQGAHGDSRHDARHGHDPRTRVGPGARPRSRRLAAVRTALGGRRIDALPLASVQRFGFWPWKRIRWSLQDLRTVVTVKPATVRP